MFTNKAYSKIFATQYKQLIGKLNHHRFNVYQHEAAPNHNTDLKYFTKFWPTGFKIDNTKTNQDLKEQWEYMGVSSG